MLKGKDELSGSQEKYKGLHPQAKELEVESQPPQILKSNAHTTIWTDFQTLCPGTLCTN